MNKDIIVKGTLDISRIILLILLFLILILSCKTVPSVKEWKGVSLSSNSWTLQIKEKNRAVLHLPFKGTVEINGEAFEEDDQNWVFYTDRLHLFFNWNDGWTESQIALQGAVRLSLDDKNKWKMSVIETPLLGSVLQGEIRFRRKKIKGDRAIDFMSRRLARTRSVTDFIQRTLTVSDYNFDDSKNDLFSKDFNKKIKQLLFPEVYGFTEEYPQPPIQNEQTDRLVRGEEIQWDTLYTSEYFPEELWDVRNSGTLFRDFEEASNFIYINCIWQELWKSILVQSNIQEKTR